MTDSVLKGLSAAVQEDPEARSNAGLMEELVSEALDRLQGRAVPELRELARGTSELAQQWRGIVGEGREIWTAWYAGQLQSLASLLHASLARELSMPTLAMLKRKHVPALLAALEQGDRTLSDLADAIGIDLSQADREVTRMADRDLVHTMKEGRVRWVSLAGEGHRVLDKHRAERIQASGLERTTSRRRSPEVVEAPLVLLINALVDATRAISAQQAEAAQTSRATQELVREIAANASEAVRELVSRAPARILTIKIPQDKIPNVVGAGGEMIRSIAARSGCRIEIGDDGRVSIASTDESAARKAVALIEELTATAELNKVYLGKVVRVVDFGAFVEILPGTDGLLHVSQMAAHAVQDVRSEMKEGDQILVKVVNIDPSGKIRLSRKALKADAQADVEEVKSFEERFTAALEAGRQAYRGEKDKERG
jgi:predicted RNA-binding protein with RPS1 domain/DNA-binding MarR family transcriptional regulator